MKARSYIAIGIALAVFLFARGIFQESSPKNSAFAQEKEEEKAPEEADDADAGESQAVEEANTAPLSLPGPVPGVSPETFRMIEMIEKKNRDLKQREENIQLREQHLKALEQKIQQDLKKIEDAIAKSQEQIGIQKNLIKKNVEALVKAYSSMKPQEAANLLEAINEDLAIQIISGMKSKVAGKVLSKLDVRVAKNISEKLAGKRKNRKK